MCAPILSHSSPTNNLLLKITVPKRTGRKRKRGSQDPYVDEVGGISSLPEDGNGAILSGNVCSHSRNDSPAQLLRTLRDNVDNYKVEAVGEIDTTHRFRGMGLKERRCGPHTNLRFQASPISTIQRPIPNLCPNLKNWFFLVKVLLSLSLNPPLYKC
jgi:hypothetical protein